MAARAQPQLAAMRTRNGAADGQADTGTGTRTRRQGFGRTLRARCTAAEHLEDTLAPGRRDARAAITHRQHDLVGLPLLWCDALLLTQLLDNLVDNALKYSPAEAPVEILVRRQADQLVLAVRDRGPGIAPAWRERVFEVFRRGAPGPEGAADAALTPRARAGAGVGLAVCRAIARAHGGELRLRPRGHGGCSFECVLPLREQPLQPPAEGSSAEEMPP
jgi:two-component system sensor histidine kinase KdpD